MKSITTIAFLIFVAAVKAQTPLPHSPVQTLANELTATLTTDRQKATAIFYWITENIDYRTVSPITYAQRFRTRSSSIDDDTSSLLKPLDVRVAEGVLERGEAVCDGYARLFKTMCDYAGVRAAVVNGYARGSGSRNFRSNHSWNAVYFDSAWHLLDATWASGYTNFRGDVFVRKYDSRYFLTPPMQFVYDHYPEDPFWSLLPEPPVLSEFGRTPFRHTGFVRQPVQSFAPAKGIIEAVVGDTVWIELEAANKGGKLEVWDTPFGDPRLHTGPVWTTYPEKKPVVAGNKLRYPYVVASPQDRWLYVVHNDESILQYRLQVRPSAVVMGRKSENSEGPQAGTTEK